MLRYAVNRIVWTIPVLLIAVSLTFFLVRSIDGDPFRHGAARSPLARLEVVTSSLALAFPAFLVGTLLIYLFAVRLDLVPTTGWDGWRAKILPTVTLGLVPLAFCARLARGAVLETMRDDYVRTARAKGLRGRRIVAQHVLRNSLIPVLSAVGPLLGALVTTLFVVEVVFAVPGLTRHYVSATTASDYPLLMGMTVVLTVFVIVANLLVDLALAGLDPRLRER